MDWVLLLPLSSVEDLGFSGYRRVVGRHSRVLHDVERSSSHIDDIDLVSGKVEQYMRVVAYRIDCQYLVPGTW